MTSDQLEKIVILLEEIFGILEKTVSRPKMNLFDDNTFEALKILESIKRDLNIQ